jgi:hypothetical protein
MSVHAKEQPTLATLLASKDEMVSRLAGLGVRISGKVADPWDRLLDLSAELAAHHPDLGGKADEIRSLLSWEAARHRLAHELAGGPRRVRTAADLQEELPTRLAGEAIATIWQQDVLEPREVARALGAKPTNREKVSSLRKRSHLLGVPRDRGYLYPAFQIDIGRREIYPEVREVNELLGAEQDPWGVASWWVSQNDWLAARPVDLVGTDRSKALIEAARAVVAPVG